MTIRFIRLFFLILSVICGYYLGSLFSDMSRQGEMVGAGIGLVVGALIIFLETKMRHVSLRNLSAAAFGLVFGFMMAWMISVILKLIPMDPIVFSSLKIIFMLIFCYLGMIISVQGKDEFNLVIPYVRFSREDQRDQIYLLDTSVIIDGRISAICETGFLEGKLVLPRFILQELHHIADSANDEKRARGRRGLDMLDMIKDISGVEVIVRDESLPEIKEVDAKLVRLAKILDCPVLTTDFNLNKVATLEGVKVLNINDLANSVRPVVFPGENMSVYIRREGKEKNQGLAFLDDGTMIVVDGARKLIGKQVNVSVTSVLQTSAGRMIFASLLEKDEQKRQPPKGQNNRKQGQDRPRQDQARMRPDQGQKKTAQEEKKQEGSADDIPDDEGKQGNMPFQREQDVDTAPDTLDDMAENE